MGLLDSLRDLLLNVLSADGEEANYDMQRATQMLKLRDYYNGKHKKAFKTRLGDSDDNVTLNYVKLIINRGVTMLLGAGVGFNMPGNDDDPLQTAIDDIWEANKKDVLLQDIGKFAAIYGTPMIKFVSNGTTDRQGNDVVRMIALNPVNWTVHSQPDDIETVVSYVGRFAYVRPNGTKTVRKQVIAKALVEDEVGWTITDYELNAGKWEIVGAPELWPWDFPPIIHWKNLPNPGEVYGSPDIDDDLIDLQDRVNYVASNIMKIIRYHAHPRTWGRGGKLPKASDWSPDKILLLTGEHASMQNLEMKSDLTSSLNFLKVLETAFFDASQTIDLHSISDWVGQLTNFGLRVLFYDAVAKIEMKQKLWSEALVEVNRRLLLIEGHPQATERGVIEWPDVLPENDQEQLETDRFELEMELVSRQTVSVNRGHDWEEEQKKIKKEEKKEMKEGPKSQGEVIPLLPDSNVGKHTEDVEE